MLLYKEDFHPCPRRSTVDYRRVRSAEDFDSWVKIVNRALHG
jgi:hypothetical protein